VASYWYEYSAFCLSCWKYTLRRNIIFFRVLALYSVSTLLGVKMCLSADLQRTWRYFSCCLLLPSCLRISKTPLIAYPIRRRILGSQRKKERFRPSGCGLLQRFTPARVITCVLQILITWLKTTHNKIRPWHQNNTVGTTTRLRAGRCAVWISAGKRYFSLRLLYSVIIGKSSSMKGSC
jgi:hypothetical protein